MEETSLTLLEKLQRPNLDQDAWLRFDQLFRPVLLGWVKSRVPEKDRDDLCQSVMMSVCKAIPRFERRECESLRHWLRKITSNAIVQYGTRGQRLSLVELGESLGQEDSELRRLWDAEHDANVIRHLITLVKPQFEERTWRAFELVWLKGMSPAEAAVELGQSLGSVYTASSRVLARFRSMGGEFLE